jgi:hypothetical protein
MIIQPYDTKSRMQTSYGTVLTPFSKAIQAKVDIECFVYRWLIRASSGWLICRRPQNTPCVGVVDGCRDHTNRAPRSMPAKPSYDDSRPGEVIASSEDFACSVIAVDPFPNGQTIQPVNPNFEGMREPWQRRQWSPTHPPSKNPRKPTLRK